MNKLREVKDDQGRDITTFHSELSFVCFVFLNEVHLESTVSV